jgi:hypothetical protein
MLTVVILLAPAYSAGTGSGTVIENGGDRGAPGVVDVQGDCVITYTGGGVQRATTSNVVTTTVDPGYDLSALPSPSGQTGGPGTQVYYPYSVTNNANCTDTVTFEALNAAGEAWMLALLLDNGAGGGIAGDGVHQPGENDSLSSSLSLAPGETVHFFLMVTIPPAAANGASSTNIVTVKNQSGTGAEDNWPAANGRDSQSHQTTTTCVTGALAVTIDTVDPASIPASGISVISWTANSDADYFIEVGGTGVKGTGTQIASGTCQAGIQVQSQVSEQNLPDNVISTVFVIVETATDTAFDSCEITDDQAPPVIELTRITVTGFVTDPTVPAVVANGQVYPVNGGQYSFTINAPVGSEIIITATNADGFTAIRKITVTKQ